MVKLIKLNFSQITLRMVNPQLRIGHPECYMVKTDAVSRFYYYCLQQQQQTTTNNNNNSNRTNMAILLAHFCPKALGMARPLSRRMVILAIVGLEGAMVL